MDNDKSGNIFVIGLAIIIFLILLLDTAKETEPIYTVSTEKMTIYYETETSSKTVDDFTPSSSKTKNPESPYVFDDDDDYDNPDYDVDDLDELENY